MKKFLKDSKIINIITPLILATIIVTIIFCSVNAFVYFKSVKKSREGLPLYYEFKPNTIEYTYDVDLDADISEQFLSYQVSYGIDVSEWQGVIDWEKVRATGITFAMIRCGFRETVGKNIKEDAKFKMNVEGAIKAGLKVGVYFFGTAKNEKEALEEAEFTVNLIKDYNLTYPVVYDFETFDEGRLKNVSYSTITDNILTFTETVSSYGYETMVYSYHNAFSYMLDTGKLDGKLIWLAHWVEQTNYTGNYHMWQYSDKGKVDGIKTSVDLNISYITYVDNEEDIIENPNYVYPPNVDFKEQYDVVKTKRATTIRTSPTTSIPNRLGTIKRNTKLNRIGVSDEYSKVLYNDREVYILNKDISVVG